MTPMPPACAMAIAICASVTVSMAEATMGMLSEMVRVMRERISVSAGSTSESPGLMSTSSKAKPSRGPLDGIPLLIANSASARGAGLLGAGCIEKTGRKDENLLREGHAPAHIFLSLDRPLLGWRRFLACPCTDS